MFARRLLVVLSCAVAAAACSPSSSVDQSQYLAQYTAALCTKVANCCPTEAADAGFTVAACETKETAASAGFAALLATGHVTYNGTAAASCNSEIASVSCGALAGPTGPADCALVLVGTQANGASCSAGSECVSGFCNNVTLDNSGNVTAPGACAALGTANQACPEPTTGKGASGAYCAPGTVIHYAGATCTCTPTVANGADCTVAAEELCASGYCDPATTKCATIPADLTVQACVGTIANF